MRRRLALLVAAATTLGVGGAIPAAYAANPASQTAASASGPSRVLRVDQGGYVADQAKTAYLMSSTQLSSVQVEVVGPMPRAGSAASTYAPVSSLGRTWSGAYPDVYAVDLSAVRRPGTYRLLSPGARTTTFRVTATDRVDATLLTDGVKFDQVQRDGADVIPGPLHRKPAHLNDRHASVYATPSFDPNSDEIKGADLTKIGGPVDVEGGWYDAGDFLKLTHSAAYADILLYASARALGSAAPASLLAEARFGTRWLSKMWDSKRKILYLQVGIGTGNNAGTFYGDHDIWRLPQADDSDTSPLDRYAAAHRPVFEAAPPGKPISPNLAGRVSAAFALAAQADARTHPTAAARELADAQGVYALADTTHPPNPLTTALPNDYYPESTWQDDMELGATEIGLARQAMHRAPGHYATQAQRWARDYLADETGDTLNLYDVSALAHLDLVRLLASDRSAGPMTLRLLADVRRQVDGGVAHSAIDPFGAAGNVDDFDVDSHTFGLIATAGWYAALTGDHRYDAFVARERGWLLGANAWGSSFVVGVGTTFPQCMQHQVANLSGSLDGAAPLDVGAVVNGPNGAEQIAGGLGGLVDGMRACKGSTNFAPYDGSGSVYRDDVRSWQTDEPALDMTGAAIAASAATLAEHTATRAMPAHVFAPYYESYLKDSPAKLSAASGAKYLTLAFVQTAKRGSCTPLWNGNPDTPISTSQYGADIAAIRARGGDVIASFGGYSADQDGTEIADSCASVAGVAAAYEKVITTYDLRRVDMDIEAKSQTNAVGIARRSKAIAVVQAWARAHHRQLQVSYTIGTTADGVPRPLLKVLESAQHYGARVDVANIMTFDYYDGLPHNMARDAEHTVTVATHQLATIWHRPAGTLWGRIGITQMIGIDDYGPPEVFWPAQAPGMLAWAQHRGVDTLSLWALQRDNGGCPGTAGSNVCSGVHQQKWAFSNAWDGFNRS